MSAPRLSSITAALVLLLGCTADDQASSGMGLSAGASMTPGTSSESDAGTEAGTESSATSGEATGDPATGSPATGDPATGSPATGDPATSDPTTGDPTTGDTSSTGFVPTVGDGVFLFTGAGGNNYDTSAESLETLLAGAGIGVTRSDVITGDVTAEHGCLVLLNPLDVLPPEVGDAAQAMVDGGGRVVFQTEHSNYGGHDNANALLSDMGSSLRSLPESHTGWAMLDLAAAPPLTDGVSELAPFYVARIDVGAGEAIATLTGEDWVVIAREAVGPGEVVVVGDGSMFGYSLANADNERFILNFAEL